MVVQVNEISTPPTPADPPALFEERATQVWSDLAQAVPKMNQQAQEIEQIGAGAEAAKVRAIAEADAAIGYRNETRSARDAAELSAGAASSSQQQAALDSQDAAGSAKQAEDARDEARLAASDAENRVPMTDATGAALLPEGSDAQRPAVGNIPPGALVVRGSTQDPADYKPEFWNRVAAAWHAFASRPWVSAITNALGQRVTALEAVTNTANGAAPYYGCRAWCRFKGTDTVTVYGGGNVLGVTDNGVGNYAVNLTIEMPHLSYAVIATGSNDAGFTNASMPTLRRDNPGSYQYVNILCKMTASAGNVDDPLVSVALFC